LHRAKEFRKVGVREPEEGEADTFVYEGGLIYLEPSPTGGLTTTEEGPSVSRGKKGKDR